MKTMCHGICIYTLKFLSNESYFYMLFISSVMNMVFYKFSNLGTTKLHTLTKFRPYHNRSSCQSARMKCYNGSYMMCVAKPTSLLWPPMSWSQISTRPSATTLFTGLCLYAACATWITQQTFPITSLSQAIFKTEREVDNPTISYLLAGSFSHDNNTPCKSVAVQYMLILPM